MDYRCRMRHGSGRQKILVPHDVYRHGIHDRFDGGRSMRGMVEIMAADKRRRRSARLPFIGNQASDRQHTNPATECFYETPPPIRQA